MAGDLLREGGFGYDTIAEALRPQVAAMEDAQGDLIGAAEDKRLPERRFSKAREALGAGRRELAAKFEELGLVGRAIDFASGRSHSTIRGTGRAGVFFANPKETDLAGVDGIITGVEAGTVLSMPISREDALVLHVHTKGGFRPPRLPHNYVVLAHEAEFTVGPDPDAPPPDPDAEPDVLPKVV